MKKINKLFIIGGCLIIVLIGVIFLIPKSKNTTSNNATKEEYDISELTEINIKTLSEMFKEDKKYIIYISNSQSKFDASFSQNLKKINQKIYVIDILDISEDDEYYNEYEEIITKATTFYKENVNDTTESLLGTTPLLIISQNNKIINALLGAKEYSEIENWINDNI